MQMSDKVRDDIVEAASSALDALAAHVKALEKKVVLLESDVAMLDGTIKTMERLSEITDGLRAESFDRARAVRDERNWLRTRVAELERAVIRLRVSGQALAAFRSHHQSCSIEQTDFCTCGLYANHAKWRLALEEAEGRKPHFGYGPP
jgi:hypothetical protein